MRSRGDPSQLQPQSHTGTLQVAFSSIFFFFPKGEIRVQFLRRERIAEESSFSLPAGYGFLEGHRRFRRPSHVIGAETRVSGHLNFSRRHRRYHFRKATLSMLPLQRT